MTDKFDARESGWTLDKALCYMHITPTCENCKHIEFISRYTSISTRRCHKHGQDEPSLCEDWQPQRDVVKHAAFAAMAYQQLSKDELR